MEAVAAFALACNALQVIGYGKDTLLLLRDFYKHGSLKAHQSVAEHAKQLSRPTEELQSLIQQTEASGKVLTAQQRQLRDTAGECIEVSRTLQDELAQLKKKDGDGVRVAISKVFKTMRRKGSIKEMETILSKYQTILDKWMLVNLTFDQAKLITEQQDRFHALDDRLVSFIRGWAADHADSKMVLDQVEDKLVQEKRHQVFDWLSTIPYRKHHSNIIRSVLKGSGQWLLTSPDYRNWWKSSTSSILWLHGMPGCGKTRLTARVIKELLQERRLHNSSNPFAYFYCAQTIGESERSDPCEILRCLLLQLSLVGNDDTVIPAIIAEWNTRNKEAGKRPSDIEPLTISECVTFMLQIAEKSSPTIVIDALDECTPSTRHELLNALERMVQKSGNVVKIFASSREDSDIKRRMSSKLHVLIGATENRDDIRSFIDHAIDRAIEEKSLLEGDVNDKLAREIKDALLERANGMFIWVSLVIQNLCNRERLPIAEDLENEISKLPSGLESLYAIILNRITGSAANARRIAVTSIQWLSRARASLSCEEFAAAVAYTTRLEVTAQKILTVCGNLVVHDTTLDVFRFAHYTVSEYLESLDTQSEFSSVVAESIISSQCVQTCIQEILHMKPRRLDTSAKISYIQYACLYWPIHLYAVRTQMTDSSLNALRNFTKSTRSDTSQFKKWSSIVSKFPLRFLDAGIQRKVQMSFSKSHHPIFLAIAFELEALASDIAHSDNIIDENLINQVEMTPLVLACNIGNIPITKMLIERGADINANGELHSISSGDEPWPLNPMIATIYHRHWDVMRLLLSHGANLNFGFTDSATQYRFAPPLAMAVKSGAKDIVMELITAGADVNITTGMVTPIQLAAGLGHLEICQLLLDHNADPNLRCPYRHEHSISAFHIAAGAGHLSVVKVLRGVMGSGINIKHEMDSALAAAARDKRYEVTEWLLEQHADPNAATTVLGSTFLSAVQGGSVNIIKALLKHGADINHPGNRYGNALMIAADCSKDWSRSGYTPGYGGKGLGTYSLREEVFSLLLEHGADVEREVMYEFYREGRRTRRVITKDYIAREGSFIILQQLVRTVQKAGRDLDLDNLLFLAISSFQNREYIEKIRWLIEAGADVNAKLEDGTRPLHIAVQSGSLESVRLLLDHGANCHVMSNVLGSPLHAVYYRPIGNGSNSDPQAPDIDYRPQENWGKEDDIASFLLANNADIDAEGGLFGTALQAATQLFTSTHVRLLLNAGATDVHGVGYFGSALNAAAWMGNVDVVEILLEAGFDAEVQFLPYGTALHAAACYGRRPATLLLHHKREADPLWFDPRTPLDYTNFILNRHHHEFQKIFDLLLTRTTSVHTIVGIYGSVIQAAAYAGEIKRVEQLIDKGANVHEESIGFYGSVLQAACCGESRLWWDHFSLQQYPTDEDAVIFEEEEKYEELETDSHVAIVQLLLKKKVDVNVKGGYFGTPLQAAVHSDDPEIVRGLLNAGAVVTEDGEGFYGGCISGAISFGKYLMMETEAFEDNRHSGNIVEILGLLFDNISKEDFPRLIEKAVKRVRGKPNKDKLKEKRLEILKKAMKSWGKYEADIGEFFAEDEDSK